MMADTHKRVNGHTDETHDAAQDLESAGVEEYNTYIDGLSSAELQEQLVSLTRRLQTEVDKIL